MPIQRRLAACAATLTLAAGLAATAAPPAAAAGWIAPGYVRSFGGRGEAGVYAWGIAYNPVSDEILAGDYWNFKVRRYDTAGNELAAFFRATSLRKGQPYSVSVDGRANKGEIYVSEISDGKPAGYMARYSATGTYLGELQTGARYTAWHTIAGKYLYLADSHYWNNSSSPPKVRIYDLDNNFQQVSSFGTYGTTPNTGQMGVIHGLGVDAAGRIYAADAVNRTVHVYTPNGTWLYDFGSAGGGVGQFTGDLRGLAIDRASGAIYVVDAEAGQVEKFQMSASPATTPPTPVAHWGSVGIGPGQMADGGRGITVDGGGNVWVADYGNFRLLEYSSAGALIGTYPDPATPPPPGGFAQVRDVAIDAAGNVWGADSWNNRFQKFAPTGAFLGAWGRRNSDPPFGMDYPRGVGINPQNGNVWVASTRDHFLRVYDANVSYLGTAGNGTDSTATGSFRWPMDIEFVNLGGTEYAWIADYNAGRLKRVDVTAPFTERQTIPATNNGLAIDPVTNRIYVLSWKNKNVSVYDQSGSFITTWGSAGSGTCQFTNPWDIDLVNGVLYVTDAQLGRVMAFSTSGACLGQWGTKGTGPYQFNNPSGIAHDAAGNLYIADAGNDRIVQYSFSVPVPDGSDQTAPSLTLAFPSKNQILPAATVDVSGAAADGVGIASVLVAVKDQSAGRWWNAKDAVWTAQKTWNLSIVTAPSPTSVTYRFPFVGVSAGGSYLAQARATDTTGNMTTGTTVPFLTS